MPIHCPKCGKEHDVVEFEGGKLRKCSCGLMLDVSLFETVEDFTRYFENEEERKKAQSIQKDADRLCAMILDENCPRIDVEIAKQNLEDKVQKLFPDKMEVYRMIYDARFNRLWEQFRAP